MGLGGALGSEHQRIKALPLKSALRYLTCTSLEQWFRASAGTSLDDPLDDRDVMPFTVPLAKIRFRIPCHGVFFI